jgi:serine/threonine-protein phosphatase 5
MTAVIEADKCKDLGNEAYKIGNFAKAVVMYGKAIDIAFPCSDSDYDTDASSECEDGSQPDIRGILKEFPSLHIYYSNRALAQIKLENYGSAISDASKAVQLVPSFAKAYYRRGCSKVALTKYKEALRDFERCCQLSPGDGDASQRLKECKKEVQAQAFARAIATEASLAVSETIRLEEMAIPEDYKGPCFEGERPSVEFIEEMKGLFRVQKLIPAKFAYKIALESLKLLRTQPSLVEVSVGSAAQERFTVCGDVHGQYYDLLNIFEINGNPSEKNPYLFNGDFVDRGSFGVETVLTLLAYKLAFPSHMFLARGNHETQSMNRLYGFQGEIVAKYDMKLYNLFCEVFCQLPLAHVINKKVFVVHGGLFSKDDVTLAEISAIDRNREPPEAGLMAEMMWADPIAVRGRHPSKRGMGLSFGPDVTENFLKKNDLQLVIRSHEVKDNGFEIEHGGKLITVFSAPNYCDQMGNKGALIRLSFPQEKEGLAEKEIVSFDAVPHPDVRPMQYANKALFGPAFGF